MWRGALISAVLGTRLPGPGTIYVGQDLHFRKPFGLGDTVTVTVTAAEKQLEKRLASAAVAFLLANARRQSIPALAAG